MTKDQALRSAQKARQEALEALGRHGLYASTFGGSDDLTVAALRDYEDATEAAIRWTEVAAMHPKARASAVRKQTLPPFIFKFVSR